ncbi:MAG TPA: F0F1 ATP synthase subunit beta, partial [Candidatus Saccharimonas sp.]|nr:F0F1 ATP synthase subunit beta [Candidatus Saccharimonas sp.]
MPKSDKTATNQTGTIIQVIGVVVDVEFAAGQLPAIYDALTIAWGGGTIYLEVAQHLSESTVRAVSLSSTDGLHRGDPVVATGAPIAVPVGEPTLGRMFNVVGEPIDGQPAP